MTIKENYKPHCYTTEELIAIGCDADKNNIVPIKYIWVAMYDDGSIYEVAEYDDRKRLKKHVKHLNEQNRHSKMRVVKCKLVEVEE